jgi:hypothetical protein
MKKNVGRTDAYLRITCGLTMLGCGIMDRSRLMVSLGAMKVAEGITRWCPLLEVLGKDTLHWCCSEQKEEDTKLEMPSEPAFTE